MNGKFDIGRAIEHSEDILVKRSLEMSRRTSDADTASVVGHLAHYRMFGMILS